MAHTPEQNRQENGDNNLMETALGFGGLLVLGLEIAGEMIAVKNHPRPKTQRQAVGRSVQPPVEQSF